MATEQEQEEAAEKNRPSPPRMISGTLTPGARLLNVRTATIVVLIMVTLLAAIVLGPTHPVVTAVMFTAPTEPVQSQPTLSITPECPVLRPDPTFGVSVMDTETGHPVCERNPDGIAQPASTTKVMAALLVEEFITASNRSLDDNVIVQPEDKQVEWDAAVAYLQVGHAYSVRLLLYMVSILSAADATLALARYVAGSRADFLTLMNRRASSLGMLHTHYTSPYGYARTSPDNWQQGEDVSVGNYSSAHDMATLMLQFAQYPALVAIFGATEYHEGSVWLYRSINHVITDSWTGLVPPDAPSAKAVTDLHLPFQVLAVKKGCMWCEGSTIHKLSYVMLVQFQSQVVVAAFLYTTQDYFNPFVGDMLPTLLWAFHQCANPAYANYCYPPAPTPTPSPAPRP